ALWAALTGGDPVIPIFIFDTNILSKLSDQSDARVTFLHQQLTELQEKLNPLGSGIHVYHGDAMSVWEKIIATWNIKKVYVNRDYEPYAQQRDQRIHQWLESKGIEMIGKKDHVVFEKSEVVKDDGKPYTVFTPYSRKWKQRLSEHPLENYPSETLLQHLAPLRPAAMPSLEELGFTASSIIMPERVMDEQKIRVYDKQRDIPSIAGTTKLSVHFRFGTLSIRRAVREAIEWNGTWLNELIWREFYQMIIYHYPHTTDASFKPAYDRIAWRNDVEEFERWKNGTTGYPIVDAGMRELNSTGFMHNRVRMIVASFLTKHLLIDWRWGERYFAEKLLDFELASNIGGWQWAAGCGCDAVPYFRVFNPALQTAKFDPHHAYIRKWVPEFSTPQYPKPVVEHAMARDRVLRVFKEALQ
ncbi:MAG: cryptochrome/photolyase family protein, partial [Flavobacteriales bacterium]